MQVRVVQPREAFKLLGGRGWHASEDLAAPPYTLASLAAQWVGLVSLVSEEAPSRSCLGFKEGQGEPGELAPEQRTARAGAMSQWGSKRKEEKAQRLRGSFRARSDADRRRLVKILRHEAHLLGIPVREDGWVSLRDLNYYVGTTSREDLEVLAGRDNKQRMVLYTDRETWIAAESGHSMSGVVGLPVPTSPARLALTPPLPWRVPRPARRKRKCKATGALRRQASHLKCSRRRPEPWVKSPQRPRTRGSGCLSRHTRG